MAEGAAPGRRWRRRRVVVTAAVVAAVGAVLVVAFWPGHGGRRSQTQSAQSSATQTGGFSTSSVGARPLTVSQAKSVSAALTSQDPSVIAPALSAPVRATFLASPEPLLPAGAAVALDVDHQQISGGTDEVPMTVTGSSSAGRYTLLLTWEDSHWAILGTQQ